ncbi:uncharacterized protein LOC125190095 [Salvia hispanica]|uniref:uncharacterized protein LOC125190095 n=1 Tax=Salvia hispanica TaxID=49212 RepID=UPI00200992FE|nr:uncharacterized protein LOC125190095 [Salvia hispanica]
MPQDRIDEMTWEEFKTEVYDKYVPKSYRKAKAAEFHNLTQGRLSVTEYDRALCDMTRYAPEQTDTDEKLADKFREGLRHEIRMALAVRGTLTYAEALALALDVEAVMPKEKSAGNTAMTLPPPRPNHDKRRWEESRITYDNKRYRPTQNRPPYGGGQTSFNPRNDPRARPPQCNVCARERSFLEGVPEQEYGKRIEAEPSGFPSAAEGATYGLGSKPGSTTAAATACPPKTSYPARAYAISQKQPKIEQGKPESGNLAGIGEILDTPIVVLFDTGASHSFISELCVHTLSLPTRKSEHRMMVSSPVGGMIEISRFCLNVEIVLGELKLVAHDLRVMAMRDVDVILGMDWLTANFATIRCKERLITLQTPGMEPAVYHGISMNRRIAIVSALQATAMLKKGRPTYLVYLHGEEKEEARLEDVAVVRDFPNVFPEELPGPPPDRQLEFTIDLEPGAAPISKAPYRMAPKELEELKIQLQELMDLGFVRPSVSPWGAPVLFVKKKDGTNASSIC